MNNHTTFFTVDVPLMLQQLKPETPNLWGTMRAAQMVNHLKAGTTLFLAKLEDVPLTVPEDKLDRYRAFLMSDKNFAESAPKPEQYRAFENEKTADFEALKTRFIEELKRFDTVTKSDPDFWLIHPSFGRLNAEETRQLQFKHIRHHFQQFGLMPR